MLDAGVFDPIELQPITLIIMLTRPYQSALVLVLIAAAGCAHRERVPPRLSDGSASRRSPLPETAASVALVRDEIGQGLSASTHSVSQYLGGGCLFGRTTDLPLFPVIDASKSLDGYVAVGVPADGLVRFSYDEIYKGGGVCRFTVEASLKPGGRYSLRGGAKYVDGPIPILTGGRGCSLGVWDEEAGRPVELKKLTPADFCTRKK